MDPVVDHPRVAAPADADPSLDTDSAVSGAAERARELAGQAAERARDLAARGRTVLGSLGLQPKSVLVGFVGGLIVGALFARR